MSSSINGLAKRLADTSFEFTQAEAALDPTLKRLPTQAARQVLILDYLHEAQRLVNQMLEVHQGEQRRIGLPGGTKDGTVRKG